MIEPMSTKTRTAYLVFFVLVFIVVIPFIVLYSLGFRISKNLSLVPTGGIYVYATESAVNIYLDDSLEKVTGIFSKSIYIGNLNPKTYTVTVKKEGDIDWTKTVSVVDQQVAEAYPFLVPEYSTTTPVSEYALSSSTPLAKPIVSPLYQTVNALFVKPAATSTAVTVGTTTVATTSPEALAFARNDVKVWVSDHSIYAEWTGDLDDAPFDFCEASSTCQKVIKIYSNPTLRSVDFYPDRNDVVVFDQADGVYVTELDLRPPQNLVKLYSGNNVDFRFLDADELFVKDKGTYYQVAL